MEGRGRGCEERLEGGVVEREEGDGGVEKEMQH